jgi:glycerophosphoryl diester phosphodiesterase
VQRLMKPEPVQISVRTLPRTKQAQRYSRSVESRALDVHVLRRSNQVSYLLMGRFFFAQIAAGLLICGCESEPIVDNGNSPLVVAHRGASYAAPEHTFAAYDLALSLGADYIEQDVHRTSDGVLVVMHDATLDRTARGPAGNCTGPVATKTLAQLKTCDVGSWFNTAYPQLADDDYAGAKIPTLAEVLTTYSSRARFYIEIKDPELYPGIEEDLLKTLHDAGTAPGASPAVPKVYLQSFSGVALKRIKVLAPAWPLIQLVGLESPDAIVPMLAQVRQYAVGIGVHKASVTAALVAAAHASCLVVHAYTVDDPAEMSSLLTMGIEGIFTNRTDLAIDAAKSRKIASLPDHCAM